MSLPFHDPSSFVDWATSNLLWTALQIAGASLVIALASAVGLKFGGGLTLYRVVWASAAIFVVSVVFLVEMRPQSSQGRLQPVIFAAAFGGTNGGGTPNKNVIVFANISNAGDKPTSATLLQVDAVINGMVHHGRLVRLAKVNTFENDGKTLSYPESDSLYVKASHKIDVGDQVAGLLIVDFDDVTENNLMFGDAAIKLTVVDVSGRENSAETKLSDLADHHMATYPGLNPL